MGMGGMGEGGASMGGMGEGGANMGGANMGGANMGGSNMGGSPPDMMPATPDMAVPPTMGLVGYWKLDDATGTTAKDDSGNTNVGMLEGAPRLPTWTTMGVRAGSGGLTFDGTDDSVEITKFTKLPALDGAKTISLWAKWDAEVPDNNRHVFIALLNQNANPKAGLHFGFMNKKISVWNFTQVEMVGVAQPTGAAAMGWHHVVYTFDGTTHKLWIDYTMGAASAMGTTGTQMGAVIAGNFGNAIAGAAQAFKGTLDDIRIYDRALSDAEIAALHAGTP
jgi:hypothetical protein